MSATDPKSVEKQILSTFLLSRASFKDIISFPAFAELFPKDLRAHPQVKALYRELQTGRNKQCEWVKRKIGIEVEEGTKLRRHAEARRREERRLEPEEVASIELFGAAPEQPRMPFDELLTQMEAANAELEEEAQRLEDECQDVLDYVQTVVGDMSDLRYGKHAFPDAEKQVVHQLSGLRDACERVLGRPIDREE